MKRAPLAVAFVLFSLSLPPAAANPKAVVKPGISPRTSRQLSDQTAARLKARVEAQLRRVRDAAGQTDRRLAAANRALATALGRNRQSRQMNADFAAHRDRVAKTVGIAERVKRLAEIRLLDRGFAQLAEKYRPTMSQVWDASRVNRAEVDRSMLEVVRIYVDGKWVLIGPGAASGESTYDNGEAGATPPDPEPPGETAFTFTRPYALQQTSYDQGGLPSEPGHAADREAGTLNTYCSGIIANGGEGRAQIGVEVTVPAGYTRLKVVADFDLYQHIDGTALGGASGSGAGSYLQVIGTDNVERLYEVENLAGWCAGVWAYDDGLFNDYRLSRTFTIPNTGGEYQVYVGNYAWAWGGALAFGWAWNDDEVLDISVEALP